MHERAILHDGGSEAPTWLRRAMSNPNSLVNRWPCRIAPTGNDKRGLNEVKRKRKLYQYLRGWARYCCRRSSISGTICPHMPITKFAGQCLGVKRKGGASTDSAAVPTSRATDRHKTEADRSESIPTSFLGDLPFVVPPSAPAHRYWKGDCPPHQVKCSSPMTLEGRRPIQGFLVPEARKPMLQPGSQSKSLIFPVMLA
jgi:hypothetical protein